MTHFWISDFIGWFSSMHVTVSTCFFLPSSSSAPFPAALFFIAGFPVRWECDDSRCGERRHQSHPALPVSGERERRPRPGPAAAPQHRLRGQRDDTPAPLPRQLWTALQKAAGHRQQQAKPPAVLWGGVWVHWGDSDISLYLWRYAVESVQRRE